MAIIFATLLVVSVYIGFFYVFPHTDGSSFSPIGDGRVAADTIGCRSTAGEACYLVEFSSMLRGLTLSHFRFEVSGPWNYTTVNGPDVPPLALGAGACVSVLRSATSIAGVWTLTSSQWVNGSSWPVPTAANVTVILDTGLQDNSTLGNASFWVVLVHPYQGALGFGLAGVATSRPP